MYHPAFLLGQALEALATIGAATDIDAARAVASAALADLVPADKDRAAVERGARRWQRERGEVVPGG